MELSTDLYEALCTPVSAFLDLEYVVASKLFSTAAKERHVATRRLAQDSELTWRVDGFTCGGTRFFTIPLFIKPLHPLRLDTYIPDHADIDSNLRIRLKTSILCYETAVPEQSHPLIEHILLGLSTWSKQKEGLTELLRTRPFGSRIIISRITEDPKDMPIEISSDYDAEQRMLSFEALKAMWRGAVPEDYPPAIDLTELELDRQMHDSITLVRIPRAYGSRLLIFKSSTSGTHYLYNELRTLLSIPPHDNILQKPLFIVTKQCLFGGKVGVCGFISPYYPLGSLRDSIPILRNDGIETVLSIAIQICMALIHLQETAGIYCSDLRPDNIVLSSKDGNIVPILIDFEQRKNWHTWSPPEVFYLEFLQELVDSESVPESNRLHFASLLNGAGCELLAPKRDAKYRFTESHANTVWNSIPAGQQESAAVYILGKLLWCLLEGVSTASNFDTIWRAGPDDDALREFPAFERTPTRLRQLIFECTQGAPEHEGRLSPVIRSGERVFSRYDSPQSANPEQLVKSVLTSCQSWWQEELRRMDKFFEDYGKNSNSQVFDRPSLYAVLDQLRSDVMMPN